MSRFFKPSINLMNKLSYMKKLNLIFFMFLLPISVMMLNNIIQVSKEFDFVKKQRLGLQYNVALRTLIQHVQQHRGLTAVYIGGRTDLKDTIQSKEYEIEADFININNINASCRNILNVDSQWQTINKQWPGIKALLQSKDIVQAYNSHTKYISQMLDLNASVSDSSQLIIQKSVESCYLVDNIVNKMPMLTESMGQARALGANAAIKHEVSEEERQKLIFLKNNIINDLNGTTKAMNAAYSNPKIKTLLEYPIQNSFNLVNEMINLLDSQIINTDTIAIDPNEYFNLCTNSIDKIYNSIIIESNVLDEISNIEVRALAFKKNIIITLTLAILTVIVYLFVGFYYSVKGGISAIEEASEMIAAGILTERVQLEAKDETMKIGNALNRMLDTLISNFNEVKKARNTLEKLAHYDSLTGLPNRAYFIEQLDKAIKAAESSNKIVALVFMDLDKFKRINDTLGHQMGDVVLKTVAAQLSGAAGDKTTVCRLGGDEFTILLPEVSDKEEVELLCAKITELIERPLILNRTNHYIGASMGYALYPFHALDAESLLHSADMAMYEIKKKRREDLR